MVDLVKTKNMDCLEFWIELILCWCLLAYIAYVYDIEMECKKTIWSEKSACSSEKELENLLLVNDDNKCEVINLKYHICRME